MRTWFAVFHLAVIFSFLLNPSLFPTQIQLNLHNHQEVYPPPQATETASTPSDLDQDLPPFHTFLPLILHPTIIYLPLIVKPVLVPAVTLNFRSGQTFITWKERLDLTGEIYRIYRSTIPITSENLSQATFLGEVGRDSARFYANRFLNETGSAMQWQDRFADRLVIQNFSNQVPVGTGLLVWTLSSGDFGGASNGNGYYAVTVIPAGGAETLDPAYTVGPVAEAVADPDPVEIHSATSISLPENAHIFIQYMDLRNWNPTFHAPNETNQYYGVDPTAPGVANDLQYAYDYVITLPNPKYCGGSLPASLPVVFSLHGKRGNAYYNDAHDPYPDPFCAYIIMPQDESDTWYFGFAQHHDYRQGVTVEAGDTIVNYTEQARFTHALRPDPPSHRSCGGPAESLRDWPIHGRQRRPCFCRALSRRFRRYLRFSTNV